ncbi:MAG: hypothetical protein J6A05_10285 [Oscillospiraceae bacterium]|nr:hypothetical protein [Oscillospiraceae bacterium]
MSDIMIYAILLDFFLNFTDIIPTRQLETITAIMFRAAYTVNLSIGSSEDSFPDDRYASTLIAGNTSNGIVAKA